MLAAPELGQLENVPIAVPLHDDVVHKMLCKPTGSIGTLILFVL